MHPLKTFILKPKMVSVPLPTAQGHTRGQTKDGNLLYKTHRATEIKALSKHIKKQVVVLDRVVLTRLEHHFLEFLFL